ncbi:MAG: sodium/proline symporter [candidate division Zixibacteria bacterium]|nr:sodium/proline symporter [candidate division Zixibacteria bacterium]
MESNSVMVISFVVYSLFIVGVGLYSMKRRKNTDEDYVLANRELGPWASSLSASASSESGWVMLGLVGLAFNSGLSAIWIIPGIAAGYLFNWFVIAERIRKESLRSGAVTLPQFIAGMFDSDSRLLRLIPVIVITAAMLGYVAAQMNAAGKAFEVTFALPYQSGVLVGAVIVLAYTVTGGFRAICWTDIIQASFMLVALIVMPLVMLSEVGGYEMFSSILIKTDPDLLSLSGGMSGYGLLGFVIGMLGIGLGYPGQPHILSRFMAARDSATVKKAGLIAFVWMSAVYTGAISFGMFARAYFGTLADAEQALPLACSELLPPVLAGFVIAAIVAAICSTADSQLIVVSSVISRDVFGWGKKEDSSSPEVIARHQRLDRWVLVGLAVVAVFFALTENRIIFDFVLYAWSGLGAAFGPVIILGLLWKKTTKQGAIAGMLTGAVVTVVWKNVEALKAIVYELVPAFLLALALTWLVSLMTQKDK